MSNLFENSKKETSKLTFEKYHLNVPDSYIFSNVNLIIGTNGSGKTRLLKAVKEIYSYDANINIIYGYFPSLSDHRIVSNEKNIELPEDSIYDSLYFDDISFDDFFKEIESQNEFFLTELLDYHSQRQKKTGENVLKVLHDIFQDLTAKEIFVEDSKYFIKDKKGYTNTFTDAVSSFSPGELVLLYMAIFIAIQQMSKKNSVLILDEPECHLHPKALISFVKLLMGSSVFKEIWIATHSVFLVPQFEFENIVYLSNSNVVKRTSTMYRDVLFEMIESQDDNINTFFASLDLWQYYEFISECFKSPTVVDVVNSKDEQVQLFIKFLEENRPLHILDCGGGSGRLGLSLEVAGITDITYEIYDKNVNNVKFTLYDDLNNISTTYNCIVMMNFLNEVNPKEWFQLFNQIYNLMEDGSYVVFIEVRALTKGEMPNSNGFLSLAKRNLKFSFVKIKKYLK